MKGIAFPEELRAHVAAAVHHALSAMMRPAIEHAAAINTVGCYLLRHLTGAPYAPVAGSVEVLGAMPPLDIQADASRLDQHEYYLWVERQHDDGRLERVDFVSRYWPGWAEKAHSIWLGPLPPVVLWGFAEETQGRFARYSANGYITSIVQTGLNNAFQSANPPPQVAQWEMAINDALDLLTENPNTLPFLIETGLAERAQE